MVQQIIRDDFLALLNSMFEVRDICIHLGLQGVTQGNLLSKMIGLECRPAAGKSCVAVRIRGPFSKPLHSHNYLLNRQTPCVNYLH